MNVFPGQDWSQIGTWPENYYIWLLNKFRPMFIERMMKESWFNPEVGRWRPSRKKREPDCVTTRSSAKRKLREEESADVDGRAGKKLKPLTPRKKDRPPKTTTPASAKAESIDSTSRALTKRSPRYSPEATRRSTRHRHATEKVMRGDKASGDPVSPLITVSIPPAVPTPTPDFSSDQHPHIRSRTVSSTSSSTTVRSSSTPDSNSSDSTAVEVPPSTNPRAVDVGFKTLELNAMKTRARAKMESVLVEVDVPVPTKGGKVKKRSVSTPYVKDEEAQISSGRGGRRGEKILKAETEEDGLPMKKRPGRPRKAKNA
jgi:hypothetical protein